MTDNTLFAGVYKRNIKGHAAVKRALEVAAAGRHSILLWGPRRAGKKMLKAAYPEVPDIRIADSCACGEFSNPMRECTCNGTRLMRWQRRVKRIASECDMMIEVAHVPVKDWNTKFDPNWVHWYEERVVAAVEFGKTHTDIDLNRDPTAYRIFEMACRRLSLSIGDGNRIVRVARTIANLDGSEYLKGKHVAEAVQYKALCGVVSS